MAFQRVTVFNIVLAVMFICVSCDSNAPAPAAGSAHALPDPQESGAEASSPRQDLNTASPSAPVSSAATNPPSSSAGPSTPAAGPSSPAASPGSTQVPLSTNAPTTLTTDSAASRVPVSTDRISSVGPSESTPTQKPISSATTASAAALLVLLPVFAFLH